MDAFNGVGYVACELAVLMYCGLLPLLSPLLLFLSIHKTLLINSSPHLCTVRELSTTAGANAD